MTGGEVRYLQLPATDVEVSAGFDESVFGWDQNQGIFHENRR